MNKICVLQSITSNNPAFSHTYFNVQIPPADILVGANPRDIPNGRIGNQLPEDIEIFDTATLDKEVTSVYLALWHIYDTSLSTSKLTSFQVERLFISSNPDPAAVELAKKKLKVRKMNTFLCYL